jgi:hypothetical protein
VGFLLVLGLEGVCPLDQSGGRRRCEVPRGRCRVQDGLRTAVVTRSSAAGLAQARLGAQLPRDGRWRCGAAAAGETPGQVRAEFQGRRGRNRARATRGLGRAAR